MYIIEFHLVYECPTYDDLREIYSNVSWINNRTLDKLHEYSVWSLQYCKFVQNAFKLRSETFSINLNFNSASHVSVIMYFITLCFINVWNVLLWVGGLICEINILYLVSQWCHLSKWLEITRGGWTCRFGMCDGSTWK